MQAGRDAFASTVRQVEWAGLQGDRGPNRGIERNSPEQKQNLAVKLMPVCCGH